MRLLGLGLLRRYPFITERTLTITYRQVPPCSGGRAPHSSRAPLPALVPMTSAIEAGVGSGVPPQGCCEVMR
jgi:hypothetical protein